MKLLLGVSGGIAAYKACDLTSKAIKAGFDVRVVMTPSATHFVGRLTFEGLSGHPVMTDVLETGASGDWVNAVEHVQLGKWADIACIAPLTASTMAKLACGIADNALTTTWLALPDDIPQLLCPAMNTKMWEHPITVRNRGWLDDTGRYTFIEPSVKRLACGDLGPGGLAETDDILNAIVEASGIRS